MTLFESMRWVFGRASFVNLRPMGLEPVMDEVVRWLWTRTTNQPSGDRTIRFAGATQTTLSKCRPVSGGTPLQLPAGRRG
jgi:hypothetical protein